MEDFRGEVGGGLLPCAFGQRGGGKRDGGFLLKYEREGAVAFRKIFDKKLQHTTLVLCVIRLF